MSLGILCNIFELKDEIRILDAFKQYFGTLHQSSASVAYNKKLSLYCLI
jgi:hypothetical protein